MRTYSYGGFTSVPAGAFEGGAWLFSMPDVKHKAVQRAFGTSLSRERKEKYSSTIYIKDDNTGYKFRLYMSFGEWRIGYVGGMHSVPAYVETAKKLHESLASYVDL